MKKNNKLVLSSLLAVAFLSLASCGEPTISDVTSGDTSTPTSQTPSSSVTEPTTSEEVTLPPSSSETPSTSEDEFNCITIAEAIKIANKAGETPTTETYRVRGIIESVKNPAYGELTLKDDTGSIYVYGIEGYSTMEEKPLKGDEIVIEGSLKTFNGSPEFGRSTLLDFKHVDQPDVEIDETLYKEMSVEACRAKPVGEKVKLTGVVAQITYGQGYVPNGFYLIDNTNSIFVYDADAVQAVSVGNKVTILAERTNWINDKETQSAKKFGYQGCLQVANAIIKSNDKGKNEFDRSWITESTVKTILETPMDNNITTTIYKVNAYVKKQVNPGFTNYYIDDLDDKTGSYVYTSSNGNDFKWLDKFDGKLCEVLLSPINCKCTSAGATYRFLPIDVKESTYKMSEQEVPTFALEYYAYDQFFDEYNANPNLELITSISNEKLGFKDAKISYESNKPDVLDFVTDATGTKMVTKADGTATVTMKATYGTSSATLTKDIVVKNIDVSDALTVKEAIDAEDTTTVKVRGVVTASLVNKDGFYISDETGIIAITTTKDVLEKVKLGNMVTVQGKRIHSKKPTTNYAVGQSVIAGCELVLNEFGNHEYSTAHFDTTKKLEDLINLDVMEDHTTEVYVVKAKIKVIKSAYFTNIALASTTDPSAEMLLYSASAGQYTWLFEFENDAEVTLELALCNWNDKDQYKGCVLSCDNGTKKVVNSLNFH